MGNRDLVSEIHYAVDGDANSLQYLRDLSQKDWDDDEYALGGFMVEADYDLLSFCKIVEIAGPHGISMLQEYLSVDFSPSVSCAARVIAQIGGDTMTWAIPILDRQTTNEKLPLYVRNAVAKVAAQLDGRPDPDPIVDEGLAETVDALRDALNGFLGADFDDKRRIKECANALGSQADAVCAQFLNTWFETDLPGYQFQNTLRGCLPFERALLSHLQKRTAYFERAIVISSSVFSGCSDQEPFFESLLEQEDDPAVQKKIAWTLANATGEWWIDSLNDKNADSRRYAREGLQALAPKYVRRHLLALIDTVQEYAGLYGWGPEIWVIVDAMGSVEGVDDAIVEAFAKPLTDRYWRAETFFQQQYLIEALQQIGENAESPWAIRAAAKLK